MKHDGGLAYSRREEHMAKYLLTEDQKGKSGYTFWKTLMAELFPDVIVESRQNNRGILKAVKNIKNEDGNFYIIAFDQSFDNDQVVRETRKLMEYAQNKSNVCIMDIISFEYTLLEFKALTDWVFAENDELRIQREGLLEIREILISSVNKNTDYKSAPKIKDLFSQINEYNIEQLAAKLLYLITRNTGFEVSKSILGVCWRTDCCGFDDRQSDDLCGLETRRLPLSEKMLQIFNNTSLQKELGFL